MLFAPELNQLVRKPTALPEPAVDPGVAGGAERDKEFLAVNPGEAVVDG